MRVMHIHFWNDIKNIEDSTARVILGLAQPFTQLESVIACPSAERSDYQVNGCRIAPFHENRLLNRVANKWFRLGAFTYQSLIGQINRIKPDVLHFHNRQGLVDPVVARLSYKPKIVVHYHNHFEHLTIPQAADVLICVSEATRQHVEQFNAGRKRIEVLYNFIPPQLEQTAGQSTTPNTHPVILFGGGSLPHKGIAELLAAAGALEGQFELWLAGQNSHELAVDDPRFSVLGNLDFSEYVDRLAGADIVVMPSHHEPFGMVALEAMYFGKVLVCSNNGGLKEFTDERSAITVEPRNVGSLRSGLAQAIEICRENGERKRSLTAGAISKAKQFELGRVQARLAKIYASC